MNSEEQFDSDRFALQTLLQKNNIQSALNAHFPVLDWHY